MYAVSAYASIRTNTSYSAPGYLCLGKSKLVTPLVKLTEVRGTPETYLAIMMLRKVLYTRQYSKMAEEEQIEESGMRPLFWKSTYTIGFNMDPLSKLITREYELVRTVLTVWALPYRAEGV